MIRGVLTTISRGGAMHRQDLGPRGRTLASRLARRIIICLCFGLGALMSVDTVAMATNDPDNIVPTGSIGPCQQGSALESGYHQPCQTDNASMSWWLEASVEGSNPTTSPNDTAAEREINNVMNGSFQNTILHTFYDSTPVFSGSGQTDVIYRSNPDDFNSSRNYAGYMWCQDEYTGNAGNYYDCDQAYVNLLNRNTVTRALACHETGHTVGLTHGSNASPVTRDDAQVMYCMETPIDNNRDILGANNVGNINLIYD